MAAPKPTGGEPKQKKKSAAARLNHRAVTVGKPKVSLGGQGYSARRAARGHSEPDGTNAKIVSRRPPSLGTEAAAERLGSGSEGLDQIGFGLNCFGGGDYFIHQNVIPATSSEGIRVPRVRAKVSSSISVSSCTACHFMERRVESRGEKSSIKNIEGRLL